jgi:hypothetical protein
VACDSQDRWRQGGRVSLAISCHLRSCLAPQEDPCVRAIQSLQGMFNNIVRLDQAVPYWPDSDSLREDIAALVRMAGTLLEVDLAQILDACSIQVVVEQLAARDRSPTQDTVEDAATVPSDPSLSVLASSAEVQAASLEAMLNFKYVVQPEIEPAAENPPLVAGKSEPRQGWRKFASVVRKNVE